MNRKETRIEALLRDIKSGRWTLTHFRSSTANITVLCTNDDRKMVAKTYSRNTARFINHDIVKASISHLYTHGLAPSIVLSYDNGYIRNYVPGRALHHEDVHTHHQIIARKMREWHASNRSGVSHMFKNMMDWYWHAHVHHKELLEGHGVRDFMVEQEKRVRGLEVGFCHNNLLATNIIALNSPPSKYDLVVSTDSEEVASSAPVVSNVQFVDFVHSGVNYIAYDIANHFVGHIRYAFSTHEVPSEQFKREFVQSYANDRFKVNCRTVDKLIEDVNLFIPVSHCFWGLWALLMEHADGNDDDYVRYARHRQEMMNASNGRK